MKTLKSTAVALLITLFILPASKAHDNSSELEIVTYLDCISERLLWGCDSFSDSELLAIDNLRATHVTVNLTTVTWWRGNDIVKTKQFYYITGSGNQFRISSPNYTKTWVIR